MLVCQIHIQQTRTQHYLILFVTYLLETTIIGYSETEEPYIDVQRVGDATPRENENITNHDGNLHQINQRTPIGSLLAPHRLVWELI